MGGNQRDLEAGGTETCAGPASHYLRLRHKRMVKGRAVYPWNTPFG